MTRKKFRTLANGMRFVYLPKSPCPELPDSVNEPDKNTEIRTTDSPADEALPAIRSEFQAIGYHIEETTEDGFRAVHPGSWTQIVDAGVPELVDVECQTDEDGATLVRSTFGITSRTRINFYAIFSLVWSGIYVSIWNNLVTMIENDPRRGSSLLALAVSAGCFFVSFCWLMTRLEGYVTFRNQLYRRLRSRHGIHTELRNHLKQSPLAIPAYIVSGLYVAAIIPIAGAAGELYRIVLLYAVGGALLSIAILGKQEMKRMDPVLIVMLFFFSLLSIAAIPPAIFMLNIDPTGLRAQLLLANANRLLLQASATFGLTMIFGACSLGCLTMVFQMMRLLVADIDLARSSRESPKSEITAAMLFNLLIWLALLFPVVFLLWQNLRLLLACIGPDTVGVVEVVYLLTIEMQCLTGLVGDAELLHLFFQWFFSAVTLCVVSVFGLIIYRNLATLLAFFRLRFSDFDRTDDRSKWAQQELESLGNHAGKTILLVITEDPTIEASALIAPVPFVRPAVVISRGALTQLDTAEISALLAHEVGHITARHTMTFAILAFLSRWSFLGEGFLAGLYAAGRQVELQADRHAIAWLERSESGTNRQALINLLSKIESQEISRALSASVVPVQPPALGLAVRDWLPADLRQQMESYGVLRLREKLLCNANLFRFIFEHGWRVLTVYPSFDERVERIRSFTRSE